jgi:hypothetical protein
MIKCNRPHFLELIKRKGVRIIFIILFTNQFQPFAFTLNHQGILDSCFFVSSFLRPHS